MDDQSPRVNWVLRKLKSNLTGVYWSRDESAYSHMVSAMFLAEQVGVRMMKKYFEIEASKRGLGPTYKAVLHFYAQK